MAEEKNKPDISYHSSRIDMFLLEKTEEEDMALYPKRYKPINAINIWIGSSVKGNFMLCEHPYLERLPPLNIEKTYSIKLIFTNEYGNAAVSSIQNVTISSAIDRGKDRPIFEYIAESYEPWSIWEDK
jgi:hypothetical protein